MPGYWQGGFVNCPIGTSRAVSLSRIQRQDVEWMNNEIQKKMKTTNCKFLMQINDLHSLLVVSWAILARNEGLMRSVSYKYGNGMWIYFGEQLYRRRQIGLGREYKICYHRCWYVLSSHANMYDVCMCVLGDIKRMWRQIDSLEVTHIQRDYLYRPIFFSFHSFPLCELF